MSVAGIDIGSRSSKCVIMNDDAVMGYYIQDTGTGGSAVAYSAFDGVLKKTNLLRSDISYIIATGYGRVSVPFADENISEISCHAKGCNYLFPTVRTILDMGGQDCKGINIDEKGKVIDFIMNEKCAAGTGRFLELMGTILGVPLDEIGKLALKSTKKLAIAAVCVLYVKSIALTLFKKGEAKADILAATHESLSNRTVTFLKKISMVKDFAITGGIGKNVAIVTMVGEKLGLEPLVPPEPAIVGALGAAIFALQKDK